MFWIVLLPVFVRVRVGNWKKSIIRKNVKTYVSSSAEIVLIDQRNQVGEERQ